MPSGSAIFVGARESDGAAAAVDEGACRDGVVLMSQERQRQDANGGREITWVGEQRLVHGYCGRSPASVEPAPAAAVEAGPAARKVAAVRGGPAQGRAGGAAAVGCGAARDFPDAAPGVG